MIDTLLDNDIVIKVCWYGLQQETAETLLACGRLAAVLPVARFVGADRLSRAVPTAERDEALARLASMLSALDIAEPDDEELALAASFEAEAQERNVELDVGESQLLAMLLQRGLRLLLTGDKRAIRAIDTIAGVRAAQSVACLEQLIASLIERVGFGPVQASICANGRADSGLFNCFGCRSGGGQISDVSEGLQSYIADLRRGASQVLIIADNLSG